MINPGGEISWLKFMKIGKIYGVLEIFDALIEKTYVDCEGEDIISHVRLTVIKGLKKDGDEYNSGKILDPKNGKNI
jgi:uncharacterized protein (DUF2147 family)